MNDNYVIRKLIIWAELLYGKGSKCYARKFKKKKVKYYTFGSKKLKIENTVSRELALFIVASALPGNITKTRYQIAYLDLETNKDRLYASGAVYTPKEVKEEIKFLNKEQKQLKKLELPKTKTNFKKIKVTVI